MENCKQKNVPETRKMFTISHFLNVIQHVGERTYRCRIVASLGYIMQHGESFKVTLISTEYSQQLAKMGHSNKT
jgi:hypothetical protein